MKRLFFPAGACLLLSATFYSCQNAPQTAAEKGKSYIDTSTMDLAVKPGDNFFDYVNGKWYKNTTIAATESYAGAGLEMYNRTKDHIHAILDSAAKGGFAAGSIEQKVGDFYASGMDSVTIDKLGYEPVKPTLQKIDAIKDAKGVIQFVAEQTKEGNNILIAGSISADVKNSTMNIAALQQYGLGLPDRDYYFKNDPATLGVVKAYQVYIQKLFTLTGDDSVNAAKKMRL